MIVTSQNVQELMTIFNTQLKEFFMLKFNGMKPEKNLAKKLVQLGLSGNFLNNHLTLLK